MKRFNYTGRKKILREDVKVRLNGNFTEKPVIDVSISLRGYHFPTDSKVYIEPQSKTRFMRIDLGEVSQVIRRNQIPLDGFDDAEELDFRLKVVEESKGILLGLVENIKPYDKDDKLDPNQQSILPVVSTDLSSDGVLWKVEFSDQKAVLQIERELGSKDQVVRSLMFKGFVLPAAMRQILVKVVADSDWDETLSEPEELATKWLTFCEQLGAGLPNKEDESHEAWIDGAVRVLAKRIGVRHKIIDDFSAGAWK